MVLTGNSENKNATAQSNTIVAITRFSLAIVACNGPREKGYPLFCFYYIKTEQERGVELKKGIFEEKILNKTLL